VTRAVAALEAVFDKVDGFFARVAARYPGELACREGCHDCCQPGLTVTPVEALALRAHLGALDPAARADIAARAAAATGEACAALDAAGGCAIYPVRPVVCRSHGVVVRLTPPNRHTLPVLDSCPKNFQGRDLEHIDADCVLEQRTLSTLLAAVHAATRGGEVTDRVSLREILTETRQEGVAG
jgi:hypothetical protein